MKHLAYLSSLLIVCLLASCGRTSAPSANDVIYEMNLLQLSPDGTFAAAQQHLPRLKSLGIDAVRLTSVRPECGTADDLEAFLAKARETGLKVILDDEADVIYADGLYQLLNDLAQRKAGCAELKAYLEKEAACPDKATRLMYTSKSDVNATQGTEFERMGHCGSRAMALLCFTLPMGQPLICTGQEIGLHRRFDPENPVENWQPNEYTKFYQDLAQLRHSHPCLAADGGFELVATDYNVFDFKRFKGKDTVQIRVSLDAFWYDIIEKDRITSFAVFGGDEE